MSLYLVFEHVHQDLASYLEKCPPPGLPQDRIKVNTSPYKNAIVCVLKSSFNYSFFGSDLTEKSHSTQKMDKLHTKLYLGRVRTFIFYIQDQLIPFSSLIYPNINSDLLGTIRQYICEFFNFQALWSVCGHNNYNEYIISLGISYIYVY